MKIMVTGATGEYGTLAIKYIKKFAPEVDVYALVHNKSKASKLVEMGVKIREADYANYSDMVTALEGIDRLLFVSISVPGVQKNVVAAAKIAGIKYIAYTSIADPQYQKFGLQINHLETENEIKASGIPFTILRNNWYLDIMKGYLKSATDNGSFYYYAENGVIAWALKREYAEAGARVITRQGNPSILTLAGYPVSFDDMARATQEAAENRVEIHKTSEDIFKKRLANMGTSAMDTMLAANYQTYALTGNNGEDKLNPKLFESVLGHPLAKLSTAIKELI